jgi:hypothetical protein
MKLRQPAALVLACGAVAAPSVAADRPATFPLWTMEPFKDFASRTLAPKSEVARTRMLPATMYVLDEDYLQDNGRVAAPAGTQLVLLKADGRVACPIYPPKLSTGASIFALGADRHLCLLDDDADGRFDRYFYKQRNEAGFYNLFERLPSVLKTGSGGKYHRGDPAAMTPALTWVVWFEGCKVEKQRCTVSVGLSVPGFSGTSMGPISVNYGRQYPLDVASGSASFEFLGSTIHVRPRDGGSAEFALDQNFSDTPFPLK